MSESPDSDDIAAQFKLLMSEVLQGDLRRSKFRSWEIDILLDIESCELRGSAKREVIEAYQKTAQAGLQKGAPFPLRFSEYLKRR